MKRNCYKIYLNVLHSFILFKYAKTNLLTNYFNLVIILKILIQNSLKSFQISSKIPLNILSKFPFNYFKLAHYKINPTCLKLLYAC